MPEASRKTLGRLGTIFFPLRPLEPSQVSSQMGPTSMAIEIGNLGWIGPDPSALAKGIYSLGGAEKTKTEIQDDPIFGMRLVISSSS